MTGKKRISVQDVMKPDFGTIDGNHHLVPMPLQ